MEYKERIDKIIKFAVQENASDIHLPVDKKPFIRVAKQLIPIVNEKELTTKDIVGMIKAMVPEQQKIDHFLETKELDFAYTYKDDMRLRGNAFFQMGEVGVALRIIPKVRSLEELNLPKILRDYAFSKQGFFLVVGPVGQGKSTTLASMINLVNQEKAEHIVTIEHPIEYLFQDDKSIIEQREVGIDTETFQSALRSAFRQDVNIIMVGEMRDRETISTAVTAAETGHLVLSTLHTNNASQTIDRIIDSFPSHQQDQIRAQLANSLSAIFSQRLIPRLTGGVVPAYELLINTKAVANLIREGRTHEIDMVIETGSEHGMIDMNHSLVELVRKGEISVENAQRFSFNPKLLNSLL